MAKSTGPDYALRSIVVVGLVAVALIGTYTWAFWSQHKANKEAWGQLGDFIGGFLNPLVSAAALFWLSRSYALQEQELKETRLLLAESAAAQIDAALLVALSSVMSTGIIEFQANLEERKRVADWLKAPPEGATKAEIKEKEKNLAAYDSFAEHAAGETDGASLEIAAIKTRLEASGLAARLRASRLA